MPPRACASSASPRTSASTARSSYPSWTRPRTGPGWRGRAGRGVREVRPDVVISYNDFGGYGHPDHIRAAQVAVAAYERAGDPSAHPEQLADGLAPWAPAKLYETVLNFAGRPGILQRVSERGITGGGRGGAPNARRSWPAGRRRYDPVADAWRPTSMTGAPYQRRHHTAV